MEEQEEPGRIEKLKRRLYSRRGMPENDHRYEFRGIQPEVKTDWEHEERKEYMETTSGKKWSTVKRFLVFSILFFVSSVLIGALIFLRGANIVSSRNVDISVLGPVSIAGGEILDLDIMVKNENNTSLETADLLVEYPEGTREPEDLEVELPRIRETLGEIKPGETVRKKVQAVLYGEENSKKQIKISVEYRVKNSNALYYKEKVHEIIISSSPVSMIISSLKEINSDQDIEFTVSLVSNSSTPIENLMVRAEYPFGFVYEGASPNPSFDTNIWNLGNTEPGQKKDIRIRGKIKGQDGEARTFRFNVGIRSPGDVKVIAPVFMSAFQTVAIKKPFIGVTLNLDGNTGADFATRNGKQVRGDIVWTNNLSTRVYDTEIEVFFDNDLVDKSSVDVDGGFCHSLDNKIIWNQSTNNKVAVLEPGEDGRVGFSFAPQKILGGSGIYNPEMNVIVSVRGKRLSDNNVPEVINGTVTKRVRVSTDLGLSSRAVYSVGPFANDGPIPPVAEEETTFTIIWSVTNTLNAIRNARVVGTLPTYVKWLGVVDPQGEKVTYNPVGGRVTWDLGDLQPDTGFQAPPREVAFQISLSPSVSQVGSVPTLVSAISLMGQDLFTGEQLQIVRDVLTTKLSTDPEYVKEDEVVRAE